MFSLITKTVSTAYTNPLQKDLRDGDIYGVWQNDITMSNDLSSIQKKECRLNNAYL